MEARHMCRAHISCGMVPFFVLILLFSGAQARSGGRGGFTGSYEVRNVLNLGSHVRLTLDVDVQNRTSADVADARLTLRELRLPQIYGSFPSVSLPAGQSVHLSQNITVPFREYQRWQQGQPILLLEFHDQAGNLIRHRVVLQTAEPAKGKE